MEGLIRLGAAEGAADAVSGSVLGGVSTGVAAVSEVEVAELAASAAAGRSSPWPAQASASTITELRSIPGARLAELELSMSLSRRRCIMLLLVLC
jgi:hypothetical protein